MGKMMLLSTIAATIITLIILTFFACAQGPYSSFGNWDHMMGYGYGGGIMWLFIVVLVGGAIYYLLQMSKSKSFDGSSSKVESPLDILKKRYAKGEINKEEFEHKKKDLES
jgi:putative membrane protein